MKIVTLCGIVILGAFVRVEAASVVPLSVDSVRTHRAKEVLVRVIEYTDDKAELRLETVEPITRRLLDAVDIKSFTVDGRTYKFAACDALAVNAVAVESEAVRVVFECFVPKALAVVADCSLTLQGRKLGKMACVRREK